MKPNLPTPYYECKICEDEQLHPADDLYWSDQHGDWVCTMCWEDNLLPIDGHGIRLDKYLAVREAKSAEDTYIYRLLREIECYDTKWFRELGGDTAYRELKTLIFAWENWVTFAVDDA